MYSIYMQREHVNSDSLLCARCSSVLCVLLCWVLTTTSLRGKHCYPYIVWKQKTETQRDYVIFPRSGSCQWQSLDLNLSSPSSNSCNVFPLHRAGSLRNSWRRHPRFPSVRNESESCYISALHVHSCGTSNSNAALTPTKWQHKAPMA